MPDHSTLPQAIRTIIVDDEPVARRRLRRLLQDHADITVVAEAGTGRDAVDLLAECDAELVLLDVQMPQMDGFRVVEALSPALRPFIIFVTAYSEFALRAFAVHAVDYLIKPVNEQRLADALDQIRIRRKDRLGAEQGARLQRLLGDVLARGNVAPPPLPSTSASPAAARRSLERLRVKDGDRIVVVPLAEIDWLEGNGNYVNVHTREHTFVLRETMHDLEEALPPRFLRIHRSTIVNLDRIREIEAWFGGDQLVVLASGQKLKVSHGYREDLLRRTGL